MLFSSTVFVFLFLPVVIILYFLSGKKFKNILLLIASLFFYAYGEKKFIYVLIASIIVNYLLALWMDKSRDKIVLKKAILVVDILLNLGLLFYCKYLNFTISIIDAMFENLLPQTAIALPIGISFFTFQELSYVVDVYRGDAKVQKNILNLALYVSFFPQLIAGPIVRYQTIADEIENRQSNWDDITYGVKRFIVGFCKKVILANNLSNVAEYAFGFTDFTQLPIALSWMGALSFMLQIYFDFSGYSDMAIGLGRVFGFHFLENFNYPYMAKSITDFWRRWHISLSSWFRDYVYIPLGGSRVTVGRHIFNLFVVWTATGIWHGASFNFIFWGLGWFVLLVFEKYVLQPEKFQSGILKVGYAVLTFFFVNFMWVIFNAAPGLEGLKNSIKYCFAMFGMRGNEMLSDLTIFYWNQYRAFLIAGLILAFPVIPYLRNKLEKTRIGGYVCDVISVVGYLFGFVYAVSFLIIGSNNPFIYFNF